MNGMRIPVMCFRCARIYLYEGQPEARCPRCGFNRWVDPRMLVRDARDQGHGSSEGAMKTLLGILWRAADYVEEENPSEDVA